MLKQRPTSPSQTGSTMLEVLVSIVVLSFGMLGLLGMIINSLKMTTSSNYRSIAAQQLTAIADTIQASPELIATYTAAASRANTASCFTTGCTSAELAATEYGAWQTHVEKILPGGKGVICRDSSPSDGNPSAWACDGSGRPVVKICWNESQVASAWSTACFIAEL